MILSRLYWANGEVPVPGFYDGVRPLSDKEKQGFEQLGVDEAGLRKDLGVLDGVALRDRTRPQLLRANEPTAALTVIAQEASTIKGASNQVLSKASAIVSCRLVPDQESGQVAAAVSEFFARTRPGTRRSRSPSATSRTSGGWSTPKARRSRRRSRR